MNIGVYSDVGTPGGNGYGMASATVGVYGAVPYNATGTIGIYGDLGPAVVPCPPLGPPGCVTTAPDFAGYFNGDLVTTTFLYSLSDESLKQNIQNIEDPLSIINQLQPKSYEFSQESHQSMQLPRGRHAGFIAQQLKEVLPQLVVHGTHPARVDSAGNEQYAAIEFDAVNYPGLVPYLVGALQQQQQQINDLNAIINSHHNNPVQDNSADANQQSEEQKPTTAIDVTLSSKTIVLNAAQPNPFKEMTTISYFIPENVKNVKIIFTDSRGNVLKEVEIPQTGNGQLNVYAQDLSSGIYTYTLVADGVTIDTKKMVCNK